jgi:hypothetical protein
MSFRATIPTQENPREPLSRLEQKIREIGEKRMHDTGGERWTDAVIEEA